MINQNSIVAKNLKCHQQRPEKSEDGKEKALGVVTDCGCCIKTDSPAGISQGCAESEGVGAVFSLLVGKLTDSCSTINLGGDSYTGCACHTIHIFVTQHPTSNNIALPIF